MQRLKFPNFSIIAYFITVNFSLSVILIISSSKILSKDLPNWSFLQIKSLLTAYLIIFSFVLRKNYERYENISLRLSFVIFSKWSEKNVQKFLLYSMMFMKFFTIFFSRLSVWVFCYFITLYKKIVRFFLAFNIFSQYTLSKKYQKLVKSDLFLLIKIFVPILILFLWTTP